MTERNYVGGNHNFASAASWSPAGKPQPGDGLDITSGTVTAAGLTIQNTGIGLEVGDPVLVLQNTTLDTATTVFSSGEDELHPPAIDTKGRVMNSGLIVDNHNNLDINIGASSVFTNAGTISAPLGIDPTVVSISGGTLRNQGTLIAGGDGATPSGTIDLSGAISNSGDILALGGVVNITPAGNMTNSGILSVADASIPAGFNYFPTMNLQLAGKLDNTGTISNYVDMNVSGGTLHNAGTIINDGTMVLNSALTQTAKSTFVQAGTLDVEQAVTGGTIQITSGMVEFGGASTPCFIGTSSAQNFNASVDFTGEIGALKFDNTSGVMAELGPKNVLDIYGTQTDTASAPQWAQIASIHLTGGAYTQCEFQTSNTSPNTIQFAHS